MAKTPTADEIRAAVMKKRNEELKKQRISQDINEFFLIVERLMIDNTVNGVWGGEVKFKSSTTEENGEDYLNIEAEGKLYKLLVRQVYQVAKQNGVFVTIANTYCYYPCKRGNDIEKRCNKCKLKLCGNGIDFSVDFFTTASETEVLKLKILDTFGKNKDIYIKNVRDICNQKFSEGNLGDVFYFSADYWFIKKVENYTKPYPAKLEYEFSGQFARLRIPNQPCYMTIVQDEAKKQGVSITEIKAENAYCSSIKCEIIIQENKQSNEPTYFDTLRSVIEQAKVKHTEYLNLLAKQKANIQPMFADMLPKVKARLIQILTNNSEDYAHVVFRVDKGYTSAITYNEQIPFELAQEYQKLFEEEGLKVFTHSTGLTFNVYYSYIEIFLISIFKEES